jgi:predicted nucleic acid-binding OB-fold protein
MMCNGRPLTELEQETWDAYEYVLDQIPNGRMYDRISLHEAFPNLQAAFNKCCALQTYHRLTKDYSDEC